MPSVCAFACTHNNKHVLSINNVRPAAANSLLCILYNILMCKACTGVLCGHFNRAPINLRANKFHPQSRRAHLAANIIYFKRHEIMSCSLRVGNCLLRISLGSYWSTDMIKSELEGGAFKIIANFIFLLGRLNFIVPKFSIINQEQQIFTF
jgi:hypothetical protein